MKIQPISLLLAFFTILSVTSCGNNTKETTQSTDKPFNQILRGDWKLQAADKLSVGGKELSTSGIETKSDWNSCSLPTTVMGALVNDGVYPDPYSGLNLTKIDAKQFEQAWWFTTDFQSTKSDNQTYILNLDGINYRANIWLNGELVSDSSYISGAFNRFRVDVTKQLKDSINHLAIELFPPVTGDFTIGFVDWAPTPPDKNMGIWRDITLIATNEVEIKNTFVTTDVDLESLKSAEITVSTEVINNTKENQKVSLKGSIGSISFEKEVEVAANSKQVVTISPKDTSALKIENPKLWWPVGYGEPNMYDLKLEASVNGSISSSESKSFGIREVGQYFNEEGHRGFTINGKKILIKGAGWVDELFLNNTHEYDEAQMQYVVDMNMNCVRFEGFWGKDEYLYDLCDKYGLMVMAGFSCHWEWSDYIGIPCDEDYDHGFGCAIKEKEWNLLADYWKNQITWLRNHPSIYTWVGGSDFLPHPELEKKYMALLEEIDPTRPYLNAAKTHTSTVSGPSGVKMNGPYDHVPPIYWYADTVRGGAFGFNTETGPGPQPPTLWSLTKMYGGAPAWPIDSTWDYHAGRHAFGNIDRYMLSFNNRYGESESLEDFALMAQVANYEAIRPMYEAFRVNQPNTTGVVQWMLNSAWPELFWQQYDSYLNPNGAYFGTKVGCELIQGIYNYGDNSIYAVNGTLKSGKYNVSVQLFDKNSKETFKSDSTVELQGSVPEKLFELPTLNGELTFVNIVVNDEKGEKVASNFYWLSSKPDVMEPDPSKASWVYTPAKEFGDLTALRNLPEVEVEMTKSVLKGELNITLKNPSDKIAFFLELVAVSKSTGDPILPITWSNNYISLLPGEEITLTANSFGNTLKLEEIELQLQGVNLKK